ncbi:MAG: hypothetical protein FWC95_01710 [Defluviitaleaceae bacterium]|nr:hypothetical protein [Defluviitaleaceae bacterium]
MEWDVRAYLALMAIIISIVTGIIIPLVRYIIEKYFRKAKVTVIPFGKTTFLYNTSGSYIKMKFSLDCRNQDIVVNNIKVKITTNRKTGKTETLYLDWENFEPVAFTWVGYSMANSINSSALARPVKIAKNSVEPFIVEFANNNQEAANDLSALREKRKGALNSFHDAKTKEASEENNWFNFRVPEVVVESFREMDDYAKFASEYEKYFFWEVGSYLIELVIDYDDNQKNEKQFTVEIDSTDEAKMKENIDAIILGTYKAEQNLPFIFNCLYKDLSK